MQATYQENILAIHKSDKGPGGQNSSRILQLQSQNANKTSKNWAKSGKVNGTVKRDSVK